jgi:hypothetical protein
MTGTVLEDRKDRLIGDFSRDPAESLKRHSIIACGHAAQHQ